MNDFDPDWVSPPGHTIADIMTEKAIGRAKAAQMLEMSFVAFLHLLRGHYRITIGLARKLTEHFGGSVEFWMERERLYLESNETK